MLRLPALGDPAPPPRVLVTLPVLHSSEDVGLPDTA